LLGGFGFVVPRCAASTLTWGPAGSDATAGILDASIIPTNGSVTYYNVDGGAFDLVVTTSNLDSDGVASFFGVGGWWLAGSPPSSSQNPTYATVTFRFYSPGTTNPIGLLGIDFYLEDAEQTERFRNFGYFDATGTFVSTGIGGGILSFSVTPITHLTDGSFENGSPFQGGDQTGKWIQMNVSSIAVSGFTFQAHRQTSEAGSVTMTPFDPVIADYDMWAYDHFGTDASTPEIADMMADPDGDGLSNLMEYFYGTDPRVANLTNPQQTEVINGEVTLAFTRNPAASDLTAVVSGADSPGGPWAAPARSVNGGAFAALLPGVTVTETGTSSISVQVSDLYAAGDPAHPSRFLRLQVTH